MKETETARTARTDGRKKIHVVDLKTAKLIMKREKKTSIEGRDV